MEAQERNYFLILFCTVEMYIIVVFGNGEVTAHVPAYIS